MQTTPYLRVSKGKLSYDVDDHHGKIQTSDREKFPKKVSSDFQNLINNLHCT